MLRLEALQAKHGDSLLLHYGESSNPAFILVDGGPRGVWRRTLKPRLDALRKERGSTRLKPTMVMVSHIDDDHIQGLIRLTQHLLDQQGRHTDLDLDARVVWHNSFDDLFGEAGAQVVAGGTHAVSESSLAELSETVGMGMQSVLVVASVGQGRQLRDNIKGLGWSINSPFGGSGAIAEPLVVAGMGPTVVDLGDGAQITVVSPSANRLRELHAEWDAALKVEYDKLKAAAYVDDSASNLASIVALFEYVGAKILLTGDARGDDIICGVKDAGLLNGEGKLPLSLLKIPHHGSTNNVTLDFFRRLPSAHYVVSGNGDYGNPELDMFEMLLEARGDDVEPFTIHLTYDPADFRPYRRKKSEPKRPYPVADLLRLFDEAGRGRRFKVQWPAPGELSEIVDLA